MLDTGYGIYPPRAWFPTLLTALISDDDESQRSANSMRLNLPGGTL